MFGKDKDTKAKHGSEKEKAPTSFNNPVSSVIPKGVGKDAKTTKSSTTTLIARDTEMFGDVKFSGNLEIEGAVIGSIIANPGSDASVRILEKGRVEGDIRVPKVAINGEVKGNVHSTSLDLASNARIDGDVHYNTVEMMKGSQVNGSLVFSENALAHVTKGSIKPSKADKAQG